MLLAMAAALPLAMGADDMFVGTWKLNVEKSKFSPGPAPKSSTVTIAARREGQRRIGECGGAGIEVGLHGGAGRRGYYRGHGKRDRDREARR